MSLPILFFQAAIALSILVSGRRYRTAMAAVWMLFTMAMVYVYWLAFIQIGTIAVAWHYAGGSSGSTQYKTLRSRAKRLGKGRFGYLKLSCMHCAACRCRQAALKTAGAWPLLRVAPSNARRIEQRTELAVELETAARQLEARQPGHHLVGRMQAKAHWLRALPHPNLDGKERERFSWIDARAGNFQNRLVQRLNVVDLLPGITVLTIPVLIVAAFINSAGHYDERDVTMFAVIASVMGVAYLLQVLIGLYFLLRRRFLMPHLFIPGGGLRSIEWGR